MGYDGATLRTIFGELIIPESVQVVGMLQGTVFETHVTQRFRNPLDMALQIQYTFPLPVGAVLLGVEIQIGGRILKSGFVVEGARAGSMQCSPELGSLIMLDRDFQENYAFDLSRIAPKAPCTAILRYAKILGLERRKLRLTVPAAMASRTGGTTFHAVLNARDPHQRLEAGATAPYPFELKLQLKDEFACAHVTSSSHSINVHRVAGSLGKTSEVILVENALLDCDIDLIVSDLGRDSIVALERGLDGPRSYAMVASFCPRIAQDSCRPASVKFLIEKSVVTAGYNVAIARRVLWLMLLRLNSEDRFSLSSFDRWVEHRSPGLWKSNESTITAAKRWVCGLNAKDHSGDVAVDDALLSTFDLDPDSAHQKSTDVLLITNGTVSAIDRVIAAARLSGHRIFVLSVGSTAADGGLRVLAEATGGAFDVVFPGRSIKPVVLRMLEQLRSPRIFGLGLRWPEGIAPTWVSTVDLPAFDGSTVTVFANFAGEPKGELRLVGRRSPDAPVETLGHAVFGPVQPGDTISRMCCAIRLTEMGHAKDPESQVEAASLAVLAQVESDWSELVLVDFGPKTNEHGDPDTYHQASPWQQSEPMHVIVHGRRPIRCSHDPGFTPREFQRWLYTMPTERWPTTFDQLRRIGVGNHVVEWLELAVGRSVSETLVASTFVAVMAKPKSGYLALERLESNDPDSAVADCLIRTLSEMTPDTWPNHIFALELNSRETTPNVKPRESGIGHQQFEWLGDWKRTV